MSKTVHAWDLGCAPTHPRSLVPKMLEAAALQDVGPSGFNGFFASGFVLPVLFCLKYYGRRVSLLENVEFNSLDPCTLKVVLKN